MRCRKIRYHDRTAAGLALASCRHAPNGRRDEQRAYHCPHCHGWHLTSQPQRSWTLDEPTYREAAKTVAGPPYDRAQRAFRVTNHDKPVPSITILLATAAWQTSGLDIKWLKDPWAWRAIRPAYRSDTTNMETTYHRFQQACELMRQAYENEHDTKLDWNTETPLATTWEEKSSMARKAPWAWMDRGCRTITTELH